MFLRCVGWGRSGMLLAVVLLLALTATRAQAASPSELLQKAIYTEETVGNLDEAIKLYEKVIAEGKSAESAAAQAQYRLGLAYLKKEKQTEATAAFEALIKNYPDEKELIAKARTHLPSELKLLPAPWTDGEAMHLNMKLATGLDIGTMIYMVDSAKHEGQDVWRCSTRGVVILNGVSSYSEVLCSKDDFSPIQSLWKHSLLGEAHAVYKPDSVTIKTVGQDAARTIDFTPPVFDNEQGAELFRRLPLEVGYKTSVSVISTLGAGELKLGLEVPEKETLEVPAGKFECYKMVLNIGQTFWISTDEHRYFVRFSAGGVTADLAKIEHRKPGETAKISGPNFSVTLPAGWHAYSHQDPSKKDETEVVFLDPHADAHAELEVKPKSTLTKERQKSPAAWTESVLGEFKKRLADFQLREKGVHEQKIGDRTAAVMVADFTDDKAKQTMYGLAVFGENSAATMRLTAPADKYAESFKDFEKIVNSLELK